MGCISSSNTEDNVKNKNIEKNLKKNKEKFRKMARILLLGIFVNNLKLINFYYRCW